MMRRLAFILALSATGAGCGSAEIVTPEPLRVVDTFPGHGSVVAGGDVPIVVTFSAAVEQDTLREAILLEETSEAGTSIRVVPTAFAEYLEDSHTATFQSTTLPPDTPYRLTVRAEIVRGADGAGLVADFIRRFKTLP